MATVTTDVRERARPTRTGFKGASGRSNGNGSRGPNDPRDSGRRIERDDDPQRYRIGMWVALAAIMMMFAALTSAYVFRVGTTGWNAIVLPRLLWLSTALIVTSSVTFELARRSLKHDDRTSYRRWLVVSLALGIGFLLSQLLAWRGLVGQGIYMPTSPHSSFFYLLTGLHGLHLLGGILGLSYLLFRAMRGSRALTYKQHAVKGRAVTDAVGMYWHFMDGLWVYLFVLLFFWR